MPDLRFNCLQLTKFKRKCKFCGKISLGSILLILYISAAKRLFIKLILFIKTLKPYYPMRYFNITSAITLCIILFGTKTTLAQVDITKYASDDLFSVKPVITQEYLEENQKTKEKDFTSLVELEVNQGLEHWSAGQYDDALDIFTQLADEYKEGIFYYYLGAISYDRKRFEEAAEYLNEALWKEPLMLEASYLLGLVSMAEGDTKAAKTRFKKLTDVPSYEPMGHNGLALLAMNKGNFKGAVFKFKKVIDLDSTFLEAYPPVISYYLVYGRMKSARKLIEQALRADPEWQEGIIIRGMISVLQDEKTDQFEKDINTLIKLDPYNYHYYSIKGFLQMELGNYHDAVKLFHKALNLELDSTRIGEFKFSSKMRRDEPMQRALNYYFEHDDIQPAVRRHLDKGICELLLDNRKKGLAFLDSANSIEDHATTYMFIGSAMKVMWGKEKEMVNAYAKAVELDSMNWRAYSYRAEGYMELKEHQKAYEDFSQVVVLQPKLKEGYKNRGTILLTYGNYQLAYKDFSVALAIDDSDYDVFFNRALASLNMGAYQQSISDLHYILSHKPKDGEAYYLLKVCSQYQGDTLQSLQYLDSASQYLKYKTGYHQELLELAMQYSKTELCLAAHNRLVKYNSYNYQHRLNRAKFLYETGEYAKAVADLEKYIKKKKDCGEGHFYLGSALQQQGDLKSSKKHFRKAEKLGYEVSE